MKLEVNAKANKPMVTPELKILATKEREAYVKYLSSRADKQYQRYVSVKNRTNANISHIEKENWECSSLTQQELNVGQRIWNLIRSQTEPVNKQIAVNITTDTWTKYLKRLYNTEEQAEL